MILSTWHLERLFDPASLIVTELMANAVAHCVAMPVTMEMVRTETGIRICVTDFCRCVPVRRQALDTEESGRGLALIEAFATEWDWELLRGRESRAGRKRVWAELAS